MTDPDVLLSQLTADSPAAAIDRAAEALAESSEAACALAGRDDYDTVTMWWAAGALSTAYTTILPHTSDELPDPAPGPGRLSAHPHRLLEVLNAATQVLDRAARAAAEPSRVYALAHAADLTAQASRACANAKVAA